MIAKFRKSKDPEVQESLKKNVLVGDRTVKAELDSGAQVSIIGADLVRMLGLKVRKLSRMWSLDGINPNESKLRTDVATDVVFTIFDKQVSLACFVVECSSVCELLLLGLNFIYENMDLVVRWLREARSAANLEDLRVPDGMGKSIDFGANIAVVGATPQEDFDAILEGMTNNFAGYNSGVGIETAYIDGLTTESSMDTGNSTVIDNSATLKSVKTLTIGCKTPFTGAGDVLESSTVTTRCNPFVSAVGSKNVGRFGMDAGRHCNKVHAEDSPGLESVLSIKRISAAKMNKTLRVHGDIEFSAVLLIRKLRVNGDNEGIVGEVPESSMIKEEFKDVFCTELPGRIDYTGKIKHAIDVIADSKPTYSRAYRMSIDDRRELERQINELIDAGRIYPTTSPYGAPVLFVKKKDGSKRLCCDFRRLNEVTIKSRFPLPLIEDLFDNLHGAKWFSSLDLASGYFQIPVLEKDQPKTAIVTPQGQYAWRVMPFGLTNAPSTFQMVMNDLFREILNKKVLVYLDDILVYSPTKEQHVKDIREVLQLLRSVKLYAKKSKCVLFKQSLNWLGHCIDVDGIHMDPRKVEAIVKWPVPKTPKEARSFLGLAGYYRRFVRNFSKIAKPLYEFMAGKQDWEVRQTVAFRMLKDALMKQPVLCSFSERYKVRVTTDASNIAVGAVLELIDDNGKSVGVVAYLSKVLIHHQLNWPVRDKEFYAIVHALRTWRHYLVGRTFELQTDHKSLETVLKSTDGNSRLQRWISMLSEFDFEIKYIPGETNRADGLSRISIHKLSISTGNMEKYIVTRIKNGYKHDSFLNQVVSILKGEGECPLELRTVVKRYSWENGLLYYGLYPGVKDRLVVPTKELQYELLRTYHSSGAAGHPGISRTYAKISKFYYWRKMKHMVTMFVKCCEECQRSKNSHMLPMGVYHPLEIPTRRFEAVNIDFVSGMKVDHGFDQIMVITDRLTKWAIFKPLTKSVSSREIAEVLLQEVVLQYGVPRFIVSDRDPKFVNSIWEEFAKRLEITCGFSTAYNPQSDGQVERLNKTMVEMLRTYVKDRPGWVKYLPLAAFAYNTTYQVAIGCSPFVALRGYKERFSGFYNPKWDKPEYFIRKGDTVRQNAHRAMVSYLREMEDKLTMIRDSVAEAQDRQSVYYNGRHRELEEFRAGDKVLIHKNAYVKSNAGRKFHYMWFGPFEVVRMVGTQSVEIKRSELSGKRHNVFNVRAVKRYISTDTQFHLVPNYTLEELRKNIRRVSRIVDITRNNDGSESLLVMLDGCTENDPVHVRSDVLRQLLSNREYNLLYNKFVKNRPYIANIMEAVS